MISECSTQQGSQNQTQTTAITLQQETVLGSAVHKAATCLWKVSELLLTFGGCPSSPLWSSSYPDVCLCTALEQRPHRQDIPLKAREKEFTSVEGTAKRECFSLRNQQLGQYQNTPVLSCYCTARYSWVLRTGTNNPKPPHCRWVTNAVWPTTLHLWQ